MVARPHGPQICEEPVPHVLLGALFQCLPRASAPDATMPQERTLLTVFRHMGLEDPTLLR